MKILAYPRDPNPYQSLLYNELVKHGVRVAYAGELTGSHTLNLLLLPPELVVRRLGGWRVVHLHWVYRFTLPVVGARRMTQMWFVLWLRTVRLLGMRLVWTAHNVVPHDRVFASDERARRELVRACDLVIAHSTRTLTDLARFAPAPRRSSVIPHGPFHPATEVHTPRDAGDRTLLFFGTIAAYKGVDDLLVALRQVPAGSSLRVIIAGECRDETLRRRIHVLAGSTHLPVDLRLHRIPDDDVAALMAQADVVVLPFRTITTSGSALLALSHGRPLIVPDLAALAELPDAAVIRYPARSHDGLLRALQLCAGLDRQELARMAAAARGHAQHTTWQDVAARTFSELRALDTTPRSRHLFARLTNDTLYRDSLLLLTNTAILSLFGFLFWMAAARLFPAAAVGEFSAVTGLVNLLAGVTALGLPAMLVRYLPTSTHGRELVTAAVGTITVVGAASCTVVLSVLGRFLSAEAQIATAVLVVVLVVTSASGAALDAGLLAMGATHLVVAKSLAGGVFKLMVIALSAGLGALGLIAAYTSGAVLAALLAAVLLWRKLVPRSRFQFRAVRLRRSQMSFSAANHLGGIFGILPSTVVPLLVLDVRGAEETAWFSVAFLLISFLNLIPSAASQALFAEASRTPEHLRRHVRRAMTGIYFLLVPVTLGLIATAPLILAVFGPSYVEHTTTATRVLAFGALITAASYVVDSTLIAGGHKKSFVLVNGVNSALVLTAVLIALPHGLVVAAVGWTIGQAVSLVASLLVRARVMSAGAPPDGR